MKKRNLFMSITLMCGFFSAAFTFDNNTVHWLWIDTKPTAILLFIAAIISAIIWYKTGFKLKKDCKK